MDSDHKEKTKMRPSHLYTVDSHYLVPIGSQIYQQEFNGSHVLSYTNIMTRDSINIEANATDVN